ncbi:MAG: peptidoglycan bridge formation glycyltransferase FemA/FemB family protein [Chloroflexota bacterium]|nr:peptidoglycan bridge formation glycyltransferase FemA/FemB family protein [Chloroflexota bacterium]
MAVQAPAPPAAPGEPAGLAVDDETWDRFVAAAPGASYLQTTPWARVKAPNGWEATRVVAGSDDTTVGAQVLTRRVPGLPWRFGYAPRGPIAREFERAAVGEFTGALRERARALHVSHVRVDPEVEEGAPLSRWLAQLGWRPAPEVQPTSTRLIDLAQGEEALWSGMHRKCRQSVNKARRAGIRVVDADGEDLRDFYRIHAEAAVRAGISPRTEATYRAIWNAFAPRGMALLLFAESASGERLATIFLVGCGQRIVDLYGGTTREGASARANYIVKWEAMLRARSAGFALYDLWGMPHPGIAQFKAGFGGREVRYVGAWDLVVDRLGRTALEAGIRLRSGYARWRRGTGPGAGAEATS